VFVQLEKNSDFENDYDRVYEAVKSKNYKKTDFALNLIDNEEKWTTPKYISDGLKWLASIVSKNLKFVNAEQEGEEIHEV